jgi:hypothetical protein
MAINIVDPIPRHFTSQATNHGKIFERVAVDIYEVQKQCVTERCGLIVLPDAP